MQINVLAIFPLTGEYFLGEIKVWETSEEMEQPVPLVVVAPRFRGL